MKMRCLGVAGALLAMAFVCSAAAQPSLEFVSQWGGIAKVVDVAGTTVYLGQGPRLIVLDVADPAAPVEVGRSDPLPSVIANVTVKGEYAYVAADLHGLRILSLADPSCPVEVGALLPQDCAVAVAVRDDVAYVADRYKGLAVISIADKTAPQLLGTFPASGSAADVALDGDLLFLADRVNGLHVLDVSDPAQPVEIGVLEAAGKACAVALHGDIACVADEDGWLHTVSVDSPESPELLASVAVRLPTDVAIVGEVAYVSPAWADVVAVSIVDPAAPVEMASIVRARAVVALAAEGERLYAACGEAGVCIVATDAEAPMVIGTWDDAAHGWSVCTEGDLVCLAGCNEGIHIVSIADPATPVGVGFVPAPESNALALKGTTLYALCRDDLVTIDLTDPATPVERSRLELPGTGTGIAFLDDIAVIITEYDGLLVVTLDVPAAPEVIAQLPIDGYGMDVILAGDLAYVAAGGLLVVSLADPSQPYVVGALSTGRPAYSIALDGDRAYLGESSVMRIVSIAEPAQPVELGAHTFGLGTRLAAIDGLLAVGLGWQGVRLVDASDPSDVEWVARFDTAGSARQVFVVDDRIYVADQDGGLVVLRVVR